MTSEPALPPLIGVVDIPEPKRELAVPPEDAPVSDKIAYEVQRRTNETLAADGEHDRMVQNEIAKGFYRGEVVGVVQAEQRVVTDAFESALGSVLGEIAKRR